MKTPGLAFCERKESKKRFSDFYKMRTVQNTSIVTL